jgi:isochorismate hydrolase
LNKRHPNLADKKECVLIIIDVQDKLFKHIYNQKKLSKNIQKLIKTSQLFDIPIIIVEQEKLGKTIIIGISNNCEVLINFCIFFDNFFWL